MTKINFSEVGSNKLSNALIAILCQFVSNCLAKNLKKALKKADVTVGGRGGIRLSKRVKNREQEIEGY